MVWIWSLDCLLLGYETSNDLSPSPSLSSKRRLWVQSFVVQHRRFRSSCFRFVTYLICEWILLRFGNFLYNHTKFLPHQFDVHLQPLYLQLHQMYDQSHLSTLYNLQPHQICDHTKLTDTLSTYNHINFLTTPNWCSCTTRHTLSNHTKCDHTKYDHTKSLLTDSLQPQ